MLQVLDGVTQVFRAAELVGDLQHIAMIGNGRDFENVRHCKLRSAVLDVLVEDLFQDLARPGLEALPEIIPTLAQPLGALQAT
jgi:hypothetical protein